MNRPKQQRDRHPAERFEAPASIERGTPLANLMGRQSIGLLAESLAAVLPEFDAKRFQRQALRGLASLGLMERAAHIGRALAAQLPADFDAAAEILMASLGPELQATEGNGLAPFFYLPHSHVIATAGVHSPQHGLRACYELTKRFTAEFCIRPLLVQHQAEALQQIGRWASDPNPHVRRLVSEGTRPRLPWGLRLKAFQTDPDPTLALLERLKNDPVRYVQRSIANHLGDIFKDNPAAAYATCERWLEEVTAPQGAQLAPLRLWTLRHALRLPAKKGEKRALRLREAARSNDADRE